MRFEFRTITSSIVGLGLTGALCASLLFASAFLASAARPAASRPAPAVRTAKCTVDIAAGKESDCALVKAKDEWILWMNSDSKPRSIHFKSGGNPFSEKSCWDVDPGARARSGPVALNIAPKTYVSYTSDIPCSANPPEGSRGTVNVVVQ